MIKNNFMLNESYENKFRIKRASNQYLYLPDGKKLIDTSLCSGTMFLGHSNKYINNKIKHQIKNGIAYGLPNTNADKYSVILKKIFKGYSKFIICGTGSEANTKVIRIARSVTKKEYIVMVSGSWHGSVDQLLFDLDQKKPNKKIHLSNGLTKDIKKKIIVVPYNDFNKTKKIIEKFKSKIALVMLEPIQQAIPSIYNEKYIKQIYKFCKTKKILICFDEIISGIRVNHFSIQNKLNLKPDISTFGKIIGGGLPVAAIGINKKIENKLKNKNNKVFFGGTFSANPLVSEIGFQNLNYIYRNNKKIYKKLEFLSKYFQNKMNLFFNNNNLNLKIIRYDSILRIIYSKNIIKNKAQRENIENKLLSKINNFQKYVMRNGVFLSKKGAIFFSYSHRLKDIKYIIKILSEASKKKFN